jgi:hypothetical protein
MGTSQCPVQGEAPVARFRESALQSFSRLARGASQVPSGLHPQSNLVGGPLVMVPGGIDFRLAEGGV